MQIRIDTGTQAVRPQHTKHYLISHIVESKSFARAEPAEVALGGSGKYQERSSLKTDSAAVAVAVPTRAWGSSQETKTREAHTMLMKKTINLGMAGKIHESQLKKQGSPDQVKLIFY